MSDHILKQCAEVARAFAAESALHDVKTFFEVFESVGLGNCNCASIVSEFGEPFELSVSSNDTRSLRVLGEVNGVGESIILSLRTNFDLLASMRSMGFCVQKEQLDVLVKCLFPPGELLAELQWRFAFFTAIRSTGIGKELRVYFNLQWGPTAARFLRVIECLSKLGQGKYAECVLRIPSIMEGWGDLVGISFDFSQREVVPAKLHFSVLKHSEYRLVRLLHWIGAAGQAETAGWFLKLVPQGAPGDLPYLLSAGLGVDKPISLKLDLVLRVLEPSVRRKLAHDIIERVQMADLKMAIERLRMQLSEGGRDALQYAGVSLSPTKQYMNFYFAPMPHERVIKMPGRVRESALVTIEKMQSPSGGFAMENHNCGSHSRRIPDGWSDVYMTALIHQELFRLDPTGITEVESRCFDYILSRRELGGWRYLPGLPYDVDDTSLAVISSNREGVFVDGNIVSSICRQQLDSGGFRTFFDRSGDYEHLSVTISAVQALWDYDRESAVRGLGFIERWFESMDRRYIQWMYSPLFPMFLLARNLTNTIEVVPRLRELTRNVVLNCRRSDGFWGNARAECFETALAIIALRFCDYVPREVGSLIGFLERCQRRDDSWPWAPLFSDGDGNWFGQTALSTLLCAGALDVLRQS